MPMKGLQGDFGGTDIFGLHAFITSRISFPCKCSSNFLLMNTTVLAQTRACKSSVLRLVQIAKSEITGV